MTDLPGIGPPLSVDADDFEQVRLCRWILTQAGLRAVVELVGGRRDGLRGTLSYRDFAGLLDACRVVMTIEED